MLYNSSPRKREHCRSERHRGQKDAPHAGRSTLIVTHFVAVVRPEVLFEFVLDELPRAQADVTTRVIVHAFVQVEHHFVLFVALITPVNSIQ